VSSAESFASISAGKFHSCALTTSGTAYCWGSNTFGQLGVGQSGGDRLLPVSVGGGYTAITAGDDFTCALTSARTVRCWGANGYGQLGRGEANPTGVGATPQDIVSNKQFISVSAGRRHVCAVAADGGGTWCWGSNMLGALGNSLQAAVRSVPERVARLR
jgi:alpha-tubulin suppressor-like RCC1 family protein